MKLKQLLSFLMCALFVNNFYATDYDIKLSVKDANGCKTKVTDFAVN